MPTSRTHALLVDAVREFTAALLNPFDVSELLHRLLGHVNRTADADGSGIMLAGRDGLRFATASDEEVVQLEQLQDELDEGACREAYASDAIIMVPDLAEHDAWPRYRARAAELGIRAVVSVPMHAAGQVIGALNVYRRAPGEWNEGQLDAIEIMTAMGAGYVLHATEMRAQHDLAEQLQQAIETRDLIGQAKGVLMVRHDVDADAAFDMLRRLSQTHNLKLRLVAARVVQDAQVGA